MQGEILEKIALFSNFFFRPSFFIQERKLIPLSRAEIDAFGLGNGPDMKENAKKVILFKFSCLHLPPGKRRIYRTRTRKTVFFARDTKY